MNGDRIENILRVNVYSSGRGSVDQIRRLTIEFSRRRPRVPMRVRTCDSPCSLLSSVRGANKFSLCLLSIIVPRVANMALTEQVQRQGRETRVLFLAISGRCTIRTFDMGTSKCLVGPIGRSTFRSTMLSYVRQLSPRGGPSLLLGSGRKVRHVSVYRLIYIRDFGRGRMYALSSNSVLRTSTALSRLVRRLGGFSIFIQPRETCVIGVSFVHQLATHRLLLASKGEVPVSRDECKRVGGDCFACVSRTWGFVVSHEGDTISQGGTLFLHISFDVGIG